MKTFELEPTNGRKSFYSKCKVLESNAGISKLISYETEVAIFDHNKNEVKIFGWFSSTTARHINAFLEFYGFKAMSKAEMNTKPCVKIK